MTTITLGSGVSSSGIVLQSGDTLDVLSGGTAVGHMARQMQGRTPQRISVVRPLAGGVVTDFVLCEAMLRYFLRKAQPPGWRLKKLTAIMVPNGATKKRMSIAAGKMSGP